MNVSMDKNDDNNNNSNNNINTDADDTHKVALPDQVPMTLPSTSEVMAVESGGADVAWKPPASFWGSGAHQPLATTHAGDNAAIPAGAMDGTPAQLSQGVTEKILAVLGKMPEVLAMQPLPLPPETRDMLQIPQMKVEEVCFPSAVETSAWSAFLDLKRKTDEATNRMVLFYDQVAKLQLTHEQEAASYRESAESIINQQRNALDTLSLNCSELRSNNERLQELLAKKTQELFEYEKANYDLNMSLKKAEQRCVHVEDRATVAENGRRIAELRCKELEMSLEYTTELVKSLRQSLGEANIDNKRALQEQYKVYEENRRDVINYYNEREKKMLNEFNNIIARNYELVIGAVKKREEQLSKCWQDMMDLQRQQHEDHIRQIQLLHEKEEKDHHSNAIRIEQDKERWYDQYRNEMVLLEQRHKEREEHVLADIARRERELGEREQRMRVVRAQEEQDFKVAFMAKEVELKTYYQRITEELRLSFDKEREKLVLSFRDQIQELSQVHLNSERELERMHREKEREMAQRYRICGYEMDDRKGEVDLRDVSFQAQSALLSKFDAIESRQRERAEKARAAFLKTSHVTNSTSFSEKEKK